MYAAADRAEEGTDEDGREEEGRRHMNIMDLKNAVNGIGFEEEKQRQMILEIGAKKKTHGYESPAVGRSRNCLHCGSRDS